MKEKLRNTTSVWVDPDDAPELNGRELEHPAGQWKVGQEPVSAQKGRAQLRARLQEAAARKRRISILLDEDVILAFKHKAGPRGYQTLINAALRHVMSEME